MIKMYTITDESYIFYKRHTVNKKDRLLDRASLEKKLSVLIQCHTDHKLEGDLTKYYFCQFIMLVNESTKVIESVGWRYTEKSQRLTSAQYQYLIKCYDSVDLNKCGLPKE